MTKSQIALLSRWTQVSLSAFAWRAQLGAARPSGAALAARLAGRR